MNDIYAHWELQRQMSTMQRLADDRNRLLRSRYISRVTALAVWIGVAWVAAYQISRTIIDYLWR